MGLKDLFNNWRYKGYTSDSEVASIRAKHTGERVRHIEQLDAMAKKYDSLEEELNSLRNQLTFVPKFDKLLIDNKQIVQVANSVIIPPHQLAMVDESVINQEKLIEYHLKEVEDALLDSVREEIAVQHEYTERGLELRAKLFIAKK